MLAPEDLVDLSEALRKANFRIATQQALAAQHLLLGLVAEGALPPTHAALASFLGPIFCTSALEQRRFESVYADWVRKRFPEELAVVEPDKRPPAPVTPPVQWRWRLAWLAVAAIVLLAPAYYAWQHWRTRVVEGVVTMDGKPVRDVAVHLGKRVAATDPEGKFRHEFRAAELPASLQASVDGRIGYAALAPRLGWMRKRFYLGASLSAQVGPVTVDIAPKQDGQFGQNEDKRATAQPTLLEATPDGGNDARQALPEPDHWQRIVWDNLAIALAPLAAFALWFAWRLVRRPVLQRRATRTSPLLREVHLSGGVRALLPGFPLRRLAQEMRRRRTVESSELQVEPTIAATLRRLGVFTPVRGSRVEPEYFALIDRTSLSDHHARLAAEIVADLARGDVQVERYDFEGDATFCRPRDTHTRAHLHRAALPGRAWRSHSVAFVELRERYPDHRVLVFSDGAGCFDGITGEAASWVATLREWPLPLLVTPLPLERWGAREWTLQQLGVEVFPLTQDGLAALISTIAGDPSKRAAGDTRGGPPMHDRSVRRWVERDPPSPALVDGLCEALQAEFKARGFAWIAACAAYPEIHWGITLRLGVATVTDPKLREELLPRVARLVWFREAFMPDWLREALLERIEPEDEESTRAALQAMLESVATGPGADIPLRIAIDAPDQRLDWWRRALKWLRTKSQWRRVRELLRNAREDSPLRDYVFLSFMTGQTARRVDLAAPGGLLRLLRTGPRTLLAPTVGGGTLAFILAAALTWLFPPYDLGAYRVGSEAIRFTPDGMQAAFAARGILVAPDGAARTTAQAIVFAASGVDKPNRKAIAARGAKLVLSNDARRFAVVDGDGSLRIGTIDPDALGGSLDASRGSILQTFSEDASWLAAGYADGRVLLWDTATGTLRHQLLSHTGAVTALAFTADSSRLVTASEDGTAIFWNVTTDAALWHQDIRLPVQAWAVAPRRDGLRAAIASVEGVSVYDSARGQAPGISALRSGPVRNLALSPDGAMLATAGEGAAVTVWSTQPGKAFAKLAELEGHTGPVGRMAFDPSGRLLATIDQLGITRLWDTASLTLAAAPLLPLDSAPAAVGDLRFSPDGLTLGVAHGAGAKLWRIPSRDGYAKAAQGRSLALMVGNDYKGTSAALRASALDVRNVAAVLRGRYGFQIVLLQDATRNTILKAMAELDNGAKPDDRVLLYLAGHGLKDNGQFSFVGQPPQGGTLGAPGDLVTGSEIADWLARLKAREVLVFGDASGARLLTVARPAATATTVPNAARVLLASYGTGEPMETPKGSPFALALVEALRVAGAGLSARALHQDLDRRMTADSKAEKQRPSYEPLPLAGDRGGTFVFPDPVEPATATEPPPQQPAQIPDTGRLPRLGAYMAQTTVSGFSAGAFMAIQFHVANSSVVRGAAAIAGGPYYCAQGNAQSAITNCTQPDAKTPLPSVAGLRAATDILAKSGRIDSTAGLAKARVWLFSGTNDTTMARSVVEAARDFYAGYMPQTGIVLVANVPAGHAMVTAGQGAACGVTGPPYLDDCDYDAAGALLTHLLGSPAPPTSRETGKLLRFDQREFTGSDASAISMADFGFAYIPQACAGQPCRIHVAFHGCKQSAEAIGDAYVRQAGYNRWADSNRIVVLYPQTVAKRSGVLNPNGCWDWWGYTGAQYHTKQGPQMRAVRAMLDRLAQPPASVAKY